MTNELEKARKTIDDADAKMADLFVKRMDAVKVIAKYKQENGLRIEDPEREAKVVEKNAARLRDPEMRDYYESFIKSNMEISKKMQRKLFDGMRVAFSGVTGAFADIAAARIFPEAVRVPCRDFKTAYEQVESGECDACVLPIENSLNGDVGQVMDLAFFGGLYINGVYEVPVLHNLLAVPGAVLSDIKTVISHPQALGQCASYIHEHGFEQKEVVNTAVAAQTVSERGDKTVAAIASEEAGRRFGLIKLEGRINGDDVNTTRFAVFSRTKADEKDPGRFIMLFTVNNEAGSLSRAIRVIGKHGFNMRALKSRPAKNLARSYYFFVEGESDVGGKNGKNMLSELKKWCNTVKVIGSYKKDVELRG